MGRNLGAIIASALLLATLSGCAQVIAYNQPSPIDREMVSTGVERTHVIGTFGAPVGRDDNDDGTMTETYSYTDGGKKNSFAAKAARILLYSAGDFFTAFLDQVIWMPAELAFRGTEYTATITYEREGNEWIARELKEVEAGKREVVREMIDDRRRSQSKRPPEGKGDTKG